MLLFRRTERYLLFVERKKTSEIFKIIGGGAVKRAEDRQQKFLL